MMAQDGIWIHTSRTTRSLMRNAKSFAQNLLCNIDSLFWTCSDGDEES